MGNWTLSLLGRNELRAPDGTPINLPTRKSFALLAYLTCSPARTAARARLAALLWENADAEQGRLHVRKALWTLRKQLEGFDAEAPIAADADSIRLVQNWSSDSAIFETAVAGAGDDPALLDAACTLYTGDFLSDFALRNAPAFDEWVAIERQRLRNVAISALRRLLDLHNAEQPADVSTMATALRLVTLDPYDEKAHRAIMDAHQKQRRAAAAIAHYQDFRSRLAGELGVEPEAETTALFEDIAGRRRTGGTPQAESTPDRHSRKAGLRRVQPGSEMVRPARPLTRKRRWPWIASLSVMSALTAAGWYAIDRPEAPRVARLSPIETDLVVSGRPALSNDGTRVIFTARPRFSDNVDLYMLSLGSAKPQRLTDAPEVDDNAAWSPSGTEIAFTRTVEGGRKPCTIHIMTVTAAAERAIGRCLTAGTAALAWADPHHLLFTDAAKDADPFRLYLLDIESGAKHPLSEPPAGSFGDDFPQVSSDGRIAFARQFGANSADVFTLDARGDKGRRLTQDSGVVSGLAWDRSGDGLFYASTRGGDAGLWWVAARGGQPQRVSSGLLDYRRVSQARDANRAVVETALDASRLMRLVDGRLQSIRASTGPSDRFPSIGPHGQILFVSRRSGKEQLWSADRPDAPARQLTHGDGWQLSDPVWSPDGQWIAFAAMRDGMNDLYLVNADGSQLLRLTEDASEDSGPQWARDSRSIYFSSRRGGQSRIWRLPVTSAAHPGAQAAVPVTPPGPGDFRLSADGRTLFYLYPGRAGIWSRPLPPALPATIAGERLLVMDFAPSDWRNWAIDGDYLYYAARPTALLFGTLRRRHLPSGRDEAIGSAAGLSRASSFAVARDGSLIVPVRALEIRLFAVDWEQ